jgi:protein-tyrosine phosphatase
MLGRVMTRPDSVFRVLVVCTGNTCRSPMAAAALRRALGADGERVVVESAGTAAWEGQPATDPTQRIAAREGVDLAGHRSRLLTREMVRSADLILVMDQTHQSAVLALGADPERVHIMSEWPAPGEPDLPLSDPYGGSAEAYEECWNRITRHVDRVAPHVREASRARSA